MQKQDRTFARTPTDLERKYNLGGEKNERRTQSEQLSQLNQSFSQFQALVKAKLGELDDKLSAYGYYPVGSIHISIDNVNPSNLFGGEWELYTEGYFVIGLEQESEEAPNELLQALDKCYVWQRMK